MNKSVVGAGVVAALATGGVGFFVGDYEPAAETVTFVSVYYSDNTVEHFDDVGACSSAIEGKECFTFDGDEVWVDMSKVSRLMTSRRVEQPD